MNVTFSGAEESFPFVAEVTAREVNIRAGEDLNFENIGRLRQGDEVVVVGKHYRWYKIRLPRDAKSFVSQDYVRMTRDSFGFVTGNRVNIRAGQGSNFAALGQANQGTVVRVLEKLDGWYRIEPIGGTFGWISEQYIKFKSNTVPAAPAVVIAADTATTAVSTASKPTENSQPELIISKPSNTPVVESNSLQPGDVFVSGRVEVLDDAQLSGDIRHKLVTADGTVYLLEGYQKVIDEFVSLRVTIDGKLKGDPLNLFFHPVIVVTRINLIL